jgi:hypothetical protein
MLTPVNRRDQEGDIVSETASSRIEAQSPQAQLLQMAAAVSASRFLFVAAQLNLADHLADGPKSAEGRT